MPGKPFTSETAREAGRKSRKPPVSMKASLRRVLEGEAPEELLQLFKEKHGYIPKERDKADLLNAALVAEALKGNTQALREVADRIDGKVADRLEAQHKVSGSIRFTKRSDD